MPCTNQLSIYLTVCQIPLVRQIFCWYYIVFVRSPIPVMTFQSNTSAFSALSFGQISFIFRHIFVWCRWIYSNKYILTNIFHQRYSKKYILSWLDSLLSDPPIFAFQPPPQVISFIVPTYKNRSVTRFRKRTKFIKVETRAQNFEKILFITNS